MCESIQRTVGGPQYLEEHLNPSYPANINFARSFFPNRTLAEKACRCRNILGLFNQWIEKLLFPAGSQLQKGHTFTIRSSCYLQILISVCDCQATVGGEE